MIYKILFFVCALIIVYLLFFGSSCRDFKSELFRHYDHQSLVEKSMNFCRDKRMIYASYGIQADGSVDAVCLTSSPLKVYNFEVLK